MGLYNGLSVGLSVGLNVGVAWAAVLVVLMGVLVVGAGVAVLGRCVGGFEASVWRWKGEIVMWLLRGCGG